MNTIFYFLSFLLCFFSSLRGNEDQTAKKRILVGSPIRQDPRILQEFVNSLDEVEKNTFVFDYCFVDDNVNPDSKEILSKFSEKHQGQCFILPPDQPAEQSLYIVNEVGHVWPNELVWKVAGFKNNIIDFAKEKNYDYLFLIDSDLVLHPKTIEQLLSAKKGIVCNIFWTSWTPGTMEMPQVWLQDTYSFHEVINGKDLPGDVALAKMHAFFNMLRQPGVYEVGGMGACTLIDRASLMKGVSFTKIKNISFWGEDRHFCIRAAALGIPMYVDTHYPAYHIYRESALEGVEAYKKECRKDLVKEEKKPRITLSMIVKNEADKYLKQVLTAAKEYITDAVIIDDASTDNSVEICKETLAGIPLKLVLNDHSKFAQECSLREQQWIETVQTNPDWIICLDADEIFESKFKDKVHELVANEDVDAYYFRLYDLWDEDHYREDQYWSAHFTYRPFLVRYKPDIKYTFKQAAQHCGRFPLEIQNYPRYVLSEFRLKHYGWADEKNRVHKYMRYKILDPEANYGWKEQYESILDPNPRLLDWKE